MFVMLTSSDNLQRRIASAQRVSIDLVSVVVVWVVFYRLSSWIFAVVQYNDQISWVFLPAGVRLLALLLLGWRGVAGLFIGAIVTNEDTNLQYVLTLSAISALAPMLAIKMCKWLFDTPVTLQGICTKNLLSMAALGATFNASFSVAQFWLSGTTPNIYSVFPMFIGDLSGALIMLILVSYVARIFQSHCGKTASEKQD